MNRLIKENLSRIPNMVIIVLSVTLTRLEMVTNSIKTSLKLGCWVVSTKN